MKGIPEQIKELQEHLDHYEAEKFRLFEEIRQIQERQKTGPVYGTEAREIDDRNRQLRKIMPLIGTKEREKSRLEKQLIGSQQTAFAL